MTAERLRTERLAGIPPTEADWREWRALLLDARVAATIGGVPPQTEARARFEADIRHWSEHGFGQWAWRDGGGAFVGRGGLRHYAVEGTPVVELCYSLVPERWGEGLATEITRATIGFGFTVLRLDRIHAFAFVGNERSVRVMAKCGFIHVGPMAHAGHPCVLYALDRPAPS